MLNIEKLAKAGINYQEGVERFGGKNELYEKYVKIFLSDETFENLCKAVEAKDIDNAFRQAHTLKGTVGNLSFNTLYEKTSVLVEELRRKDTSRLEKSIAELQKSYSNTINAIAE